MVTLYTQPTCAPCRAAERALDSAGIPYAKVDVTRDEDAAQRLRDGGFTGTPVISSNGKLHTIAELPAIIRSYN